jgi:hypothetical protein
MIEKLTPEQEAYLPIFREEWFKIGSSTEPLDQTNVEDVVTRMYAVIGLPKPTFHFCDSPYACQVKIHELKIQYGLKKPKSKMEFESTSFWGGQDAYWVAWYLFGQYIGVKYDAESKKKLELCAEYVKACGWVYVFDENCIVSQRPREIHWAANEITGQLELHNETGPSVIFADGWQVWNYHGRRLPQKYAMPIAQWQAKWLLEEENAELKTILIQGIGNERIFDELGAEFLDKWTFENDVYTLVKVTQDIDIEPMHLLKMICPSVGHPAVKRIPPQIMSAEAAITWVNHGIHPSKFSQQT